MQGILDFEFWYNLEGVPISDFNELLWTRSNWRSCLCKNCTNWADRSPTCLFVCLLMLSSLYFCSHIPCFSEIWVLSIGYLLPHELCFVRTIEYVVKHIIQPSGKPVSLPWNRRTLKCYILSKFHCYISVSNFLLNNKDTLMHWSQKLILQSWVPTSYGTHCI
jgi:hypothetical protein